MTTPISIANPVYDCVFKFLLEDTEIAKGLISLITQQRVETIQLLPQEFTTTVQDLVIRRMDYTAEVWDEQGNLKKVLIEMQKAKFPGDVPHFRHYLSHAIGKPVTVTRTAAEMARLRNNEERRRREGHTVIPAENVKDVYPPVVTIYFLGYNLSESVKAPLIKAGSGCVNLLSGKSLDGSKDEFIQCLTVTSFIIQLPEVPEKATSEIEQILGLFRELDPHKREILTELPSGEPNSSFLWRVVKRLAAAAADPEVRMAMQNEEVFERSMIQHTHDQQIKEEQALEQLNVALAEKQAAVAEKQAAVAEKQAAVAARDAAEALALTRLGETVRLLSTAGKSPEEIAAALQLTTEECASLLAQVKAS